MQSKTLVQGDSYVIKCSHPSCNFSTSARYNKKQGSRITNVKGAHTCSVNDHIILKYKSPAAHDKFLARYPRGHIINSTTSNKALMLKLQQELGCSVSSSTMNRALNVATSTYYHNHAQGYKLLMPYIGIVTSRGGYVNLETTPEHGEQQRFHRVFVTLK